MGWGEISQGTERFYKYLCHRVKDSFQLSRFNQQSTQAGRGGRANLAAVAPSLPLDADQEFIFMGHFQAGPFGRLE